MSFRNRCQLASAQGKLDLSIPLQKGRQQRSLMKDVRIAGEYSWQDQHWKAILACYSRSPWFEFYKDELEGLYRKRVEFLVDWNLACFEWTRKVLAWPVKVGMTERWVEDYGTVGQAEEMGRNVSREAGLKEKEGASDGNGLEESGRASDKKGLKEGGRASDEKGLEESGRASDKKGMEERGRASDEKGLIEKERASDKDGLKESATDGDGLTGGNWVSRADGMDGESRAGSTIGRRDRDRRNGGIALKRSLKKIDRDGEQIGSDGGGEVLDWRGRLAPKNMNDPAHGEPLVYRQVFEEITGFIPNLSILDLLFCEGQRARGLLAQVASRS